MKIAACIRVFFVLIIAISFADQHSTCLLGSSLAKQEMAGQAGGTGSLTSLPIEDVSHGDDILSELGSLCGTPEIILRNIFSCPVPARISAEPSPCWQPPEICS